MGVYIPNMEKPKECDGIGINIHFTDGHMELHILDECELIEIDLVRCGECKKVDTKKCPMYSAGWGYTDDDWCSEGERRADGDI